jgi:hypothetical protein
MKKKTWYKAIANAISMITVPTGALTILEQPMSIWGWVVLIIGLGVQIAKYYNEE